MVRITVCSVCEKQSLNGNHLKCEIARLKDLLFRVQELFKANRPISKELKKAILSEQCFPISEYIKAKEEEKKAEIKAEVKNSILGNRKRI